MGNRFYPDKEAVKQISKTGKYGRIPVKTEILADFITPIELLRVLRKKSKHVFILESVEKQEKWGRYTFLGYDPKMVLNCKDGILTVKDVSTGKVITVTNGNPDVYIKKMMKEYLSPKLQEMPTFTGGLTGYFSYDYIKYEEPELVLDANDEEGFSDLDLMLFEKVIVYDNIKQKLILINNIDTEKQDIEEGYLLAVKELKEMLKLVKSGEKETFGKTCLESDFRPLFDKDMYCSMVEKAKKHIFEGDIFQVVLSNRLEADFRGSLYGAYRVLRVTNPSPYMFYFSGTDIEVAGASPETLVKLEGGVLHTFPLAGSRRRGKDEAEDKELEYELLHDEKECAEHNMLVDLGRNDLGKICRFGTVQVEKYMSIERYSHIMHIGSTVRGEIAEGYDAMDAIGAVLPAGTLSGAPKIRACEIINELENNKRGIYGGAVGYIGFTGDMDVCIAIRLAFVKNNKVFVRSGAGIVADSIPENEYVECINKAQAVLNAIKTASEEELD